MNDLRVPPSIWEAWAGWCPHLGWGHIWETYSLWTDLILLLSMWSDSGVFSSVFRWNSCHCKTTKCIRLRHWNARLLLNIRLILPCPHHTTLSFGHWWLCAPRSSCLLDANPVSLPHAWFSGWFFTCSQSHTHRACQALQRLKAMALDHDHSSKSPST